MPQQTTFWYILRASLPTLSINETAWALRRSVMQKPRGRAWRNAHPTSSQPEHIQHGDVADVFQLRRVDEPRPRRDAGARRDRHVLLAADFEAHGRRREAGAPVG